MGDWNIDWFVKQCRALVPGMQKKQKNVSAEVTD